MNAEKNVWKCPICNKLAYLEGLEVDQYIWGIITSTGLDVEEVTIDSNAYWKPINKYESGKKNNLFFLFSIFYFPLLLLVCSLSESIESKKFNAINLIVFVVFVFCISIIIR